LSVNHSESVIYGVERGGAYAYASRVGTVADNVKRLRLAAGHRHQGKFAEKAGVPQQWLSDLENGRYEFPSSWNLILIARAVPCLVDDLLAGVDEDYDRARVAARFGDEGVTVYDLTLKRVRELVGQLAVAITGAAEMSRVIDVWRGLDIEYREFTLTELERHRDEMRDAAPVVVMPGDSIDDAALSAPKRSRRASKRGRGR
jgi:transcriptional regulator with XRE-family HTH domain